MLIIYSGVGISVGVIASVILFKSAQFSPFKTSYTLTCLSPFIGRTWPIALSTGFGMGTAYADCDRSFNPARVPGTRIIPASASTQESK